MPASPSFAEPVVADVAAIASDRLRAIVARHPRAVLASSFGAEDMVLVDLVARARLPIRVLTLDTGRLPQETHDLIDRVRDVYGLAIDVAFPDAGEVAALVAEHGTNPFYRGVDLRERCCAIRKSAPLARALEGADAWITGLRRAQGPTRTEVAFESFDTRHRLAKYSPLAEWSDADVWGYLRAHRVPWNALHDRGFPSIGCAPCTRAVQPGEDPRAGRWWWESPEHRECGLHRGPQVRVVAAAESAP